MTIRDAAQQLVNRFRETTAVHDEVAELELALAHKIANAFNLIHWQSTYQKAPAFELENNFPHIISVLRFCREGVNLPLLPAFAALLPAIGAKV
jgi:predicted helicase